jgi:hypothetical protein
VGGILERRLNEQSEFLARASRDRGGLFGVDCDEEPIEFVCNENQQFRRKVKVD